MFPLNKIKVTFNRAGSTSCPKNSLAWITVSLDCNRKGYEGCNCLEKVMFISTIIGCLILVNEYHNFPVGFLGQKVTQPIQTVRPFFFSSFIETDGFEIFMSLL